MISGFQIIHSLYESDNTSVYRAIRQADKQTVILKVLQTEFPSPTQVARYQHEYELLHQLHLSNVIQTYGLEIAQEYVVLIIEDFGADSLNAWLTQRTLTVTDKLSLAIQIAESLGQIHAAQVIHKDINPNNVVWNPTTGQLKLIDFGIATRLPRETLSLQNPNQLEGTLPYLSPEQTGRMNRALDYRTDLYSLGVTFYELFTGRLPFEMTDAMELVHCHLAKQPIPPHQINTKVPSVISYLILRLLAKAAEERYQSAWGIKADLEQILANLTNLQNLSNFTLGQHDFSDQFHLPQKLYGRETELAELLNAFENVATGRSQLLLVAGYSGIGKTALVQEIYKPITEKRGYFLAGKFDQFQRNIPYSAVVQAFRDLVRQLLTETQAQLDDWKTIILTALGNNGQVIIDVISEVELIIGPQPAVPTLPPTESQNRFNLVFQNFIKVFCQAEHPLVIFLDDLQWIDSASLKLMTLMMSDIPYLLLIGAYRDNEVSPVHPLMTTLEEMHKQGLCVRTLTLIPLGLPHLNQLISDTLRLPLPQTLPLTELVLAKTGGNPFFVGEFLKTLYMEQLLSFNSSQREWQWDLAQIHARNITDNVVELMTHKIQRLPLPTQDILKLAACVGNQFDLATLAVISQQSSEQVKTDLWEALREGLVVPFAEKYKFVHDRIQQAVYSLIEVSDRAPLHLQIGRLLKTQVLENQLFEVVDHFNIGRALIHDLLEQEEIARLNLLAGQKAKAAIAYEPALNYLNQGLALLPADCWDTAYTLTFSLHLEQIEALYLNAHFEQSQALAEIALQHAKTRLEQTTIYELKIQVHITQTQMAEALKVGLLVLDLLGVQLEQTPPVIQVAIEDLIHQPLMVEPTKIAAMRILMTIMSPAFIANPSLLAPIAFTMVHLSVTEGHSPPSAYGYSFYGLILCIGIDEIEAGYQFGQLALKLIEKFNAKEIKARTQELFHAFVRPWKEPPQNIIGSLYETIQIGLETGDIEYASYSALYCCAFPLLAGECLNTVEHHCLSHLKMVEKFKYEHMVNCIRIWKQLVLNLSGKATEKSLLMGPDFNEIEIRQRFLDTQSNASLFLLYVVKGVLLYFLKQPSSAIVMFQAADHYQEGGTSFLTGAYRFYYSLAILAFPHQEEARESTESLTQVSANQEKLKKWAFHAPMNYQHKYDLVEAEKAKVLGQFLEAEALYEKAIAGAQENKYLHEEALAYELAAEFYWVRGMNKFTQLYLREAYYRYQQWGAMVKVNDLEDKYPQWLLPHQTAAFSVIPTHTTATLPMTSVSATRLATSTDWLDLTSVLKAAQTLSDEMVLENLLEKMMRTVVENAGAQRGVLILEDQGQWLIQAEFTLQPETVTLLQAFPLSDRVPTTLLNYVIRTKQSLVFAELQQEAKYQADDYVRTHALKSVLCLTLLHQQKLVGIIYLENNLATGVFTPDRFQVLTLLSSQMAISLDNARFVKELQQARQAAEAANQAKTAFLANVSHELRTPLNGILGYTQILQRDSQLTGKQRESVASIHRSGEHLLTLVSDIIDISKLQTAKLELQPTDVRLSPLLMELTNWFRDQAQGKGLTFRYEPASHLPTGIIADGKRLRQILLHLLSNAVKFTKHGSITFQVQSTPLPNRLEWHQFQFIVTDTGIGITEAHLSKLFTPFEQVSSWQHKSAGAGLGLSIAKQLVELMGGQIQAHSQLEQGSTFIVQLDFAQSWEWQEEISEQPEISVVTETIETAAVPLKGPNADQAAKLYDLTQMGDFVGILKLITQLEQEDEELKPFTDKVRQWAKEYRDELIEELAKQFLEDSE